jgi:4-hydroxybenzoate polyprenyltransferase
MPAHFMQYVILMRLHKPIGIYLLLWPTLWAVWIAGAGQPDPFIVLIFVLGVVVMRSAGCVINDYADRDIDLHVSRTKERPITSGKVSPKEALYLFAILCLSAFFLVFWLDWYTIALSLVAVVLATIYPFMKRYTYFPQVFLGAAFAWAIPMAFMALSHSLPPITWVLFSATLLWTVAYDTLYAMVDREEDLKIGVKSTAILFASADRLIIAILQIIVLLALIWVGLMAQLEMIYFASVLIAAFFSLYQQYLIRQREPKACFQAFLNNHWFGLVIFIGIFLSYYFQ